MAPVNYLTYLLRSNRATPRVSPRIGSLNLGLNLKGFASCGSKTLLALLNLPTVVAFAVSVALLPLAAQADIISARAEMENQLNPLLQVRTSQGEFFIELFPEEAPSNSNHFLALVQGEQNVEPLLSSESESISGNASQRIQNTCQVFHLYIT